MQVISRRRYPSWPRKMLLLYRGIVSGSPNGVGEAVSCEAEVWEHGY